MTNPIHLLLSKLKQSFKKRIRIIIAHGTIAEKDAIGTDILYQFNLFKNNLNLDTYLFGEKILINNLPKKSLINERQVLKLLKTKNSFLILHYSIFWEKAEKLLNASKGYKIVKYHNITPSPFFLKYNSSFSAILELGRKQLNKLVKRKDINLWISNSNFTAQELKKLGVNKNKIAIIPPFNKIDQLKSYMAHEFNPNRAKKENSKRTNVLFVGRIVPNKGITTLIKVIKTYRDIFDNDIDLHIVGKFDPALENYKKEVLNLIEKLNVKNNVKFHVDISDKLLAKLYSSCDVLLYLSKHEGFGLPIIEAQAFNLPIIAFSAGAIPETIGENQLVFNKIDYKLIASAINLIKRNEKVRNYLIKEGYTNYLKYSNEVIKKRTLETLKKHFVLFNKHSPSSKANTEVVVVEGPFETSYSLAIVNRNVALSLKKTSLTTYLKPSEGPGDYNPKTKDLKSLHREVRELFKPHQYYPDLLIRNMYPHRVHDVYGKQNLFYFFWEESLIPSKIIDCFNTYLDGVLAPSTYVDKALRRSGLKIQSEVVGCGHLLIDPSYDKNKVEKVEEIKPELENKFIFLHISSAFPRKGVDILIKAFCEEFSKKDNVALIIKTFKNPHNNIKEILEKQRNSMVKHIIVIERDLKDGELNYLYKISSCAVYPTKGEGFGMPILEAMYMKIPVITTGYGAHRDFCNESNTFLIKYKFSQSKSHLASPGSLWIEPDLTDLRKKMRFVYENYKSEDVKSRVKNAYITSKQYTWDRVGRRIKQFYKYIKLINKPLKLGMVTTWNTKCGIASYSKYLLSNINHKRLSVKIYANREKLLDIEDEDNVTRCWNNALDKDLSELYQQIIKDKIEIVNFQFNYGFFNLQSFSDIIFQLKKANIKVVLTLHAVKDNILLNKKVSLREISDALRATDLILVHKKEDQDYLKNLTKAKKINLFPHGIIDFDEIDMHIINKNLNFKYTKKIKEKLLIGSFGYLLPHKGVLNIIKAVKLLKNKYPNIIYLGLHSLFPNPISENYLKECKKQIKKDNLENNVILDTNFHKEEEIIALLNNCKLTVFPYKKTQESTSAAVRFALASKRPIITTKNQIFRDIKEATLQIKSDSPTEIAKGVEMLINDKQLANKMVEKTKKIVEKYAWPKISKEYLKLLYHLKEN